MEQPEKSTGQDGGHDWVFVAGFVAAIAGGLVLAIALVVDVSVFVGFTSLGVFVLGCSLMGASASRQARHAGGSAGSALWRGMAETVKQVLRFLP